MHKIKNKFIIFIILIIIGIISYGVLNSYLNKNNNRVSNIVLIKGKAILNNNLLILNKKEKLTVGDTVRTIGNDALAVLEWGDGSVTRMGGNTSIKIGELYVSDNLDKINIGFILINGKTWSNVISFLGEDSYFKEFFRDSEAAVRGTVFNLDLTKEYLYVTDHKVNITTASGKLLVVNENNPLNINNFNFITLENFLKLFKDKAWESMNAKIDIELFKGLKKRINEDLDKLVKIGESNIQKALLDDLEREKLYNKVLNDYQKLNFIKSSDDNLFRLKLEMKEKLILLADDKNKKLLVENTLYDFQNMLNLKQYENINKILSIFSENKKELGSIDLNSYFNSDLIPDELKNGIFNNFDNLKGLFGVKINEIKINTNGLIHEGLDTLFNK